MESKLTSELTFNQAIAQATMQMMEEDESIILFGEGVNDPGRIFGTTTELVEKFGSTRVQESPISENAIAGIMLGAALNGLRPIMTFQRVDFSLYAFDQLINNIAKWTSMFGLENGPPMVFRMIIGQGWGQGPQHAQNLQSIFAHIPGLKVITPSLPFNAKGMLIEALKGSSPVIFLEHKWCQGIIGDVPEKIYSCPLDKAAQLKEGDQLTIVSNSYWSVESLKAAKFLSEVGIEVSVIDLRSLSPIDLKLIKKDLNKTKRLLVVDGAWREYGVSSEIITQVVEEGCAADLLSPPARLTFHSSYSPSSTTLANEYYLNAGDIYNKVLEILGVQKKSPLKEEYMKSRVWDKPDPIYNKNFPNL